MNSDILNVFSRHRNLSLALGALALAGGGLAAGLSLAPRLPAPAASLETAAAPQPATARNAPARSVAAAPAAVEREPVQAVCAQCGVVESVRAVQRKGPGTGVGAVAGGVVGAALGNQIGKGNGRAAMTVLGAVGGGFAGHEVEKRVRSETVYEVSVRMDDGSMRVVTQRQSWAAGTRVTVDGNVMRAASGASSRTQRDAQASRV